MFVFFLTMIVKKKKKMMMIMMRVGTWQNQRTTNKTGLVVCFLFYYGRDEDGKQIC